MKERHSHLRRPEVASSKERRPGRVAEEVGAQRGVEGCENRTSLLPEVEAEVLSWKHIRRVYDANICFTAALKLVFVTMCFHKGHAYLIESEVLEVGYFQG